MLDLAVLQIIKRRDQFNKVAKFMHKDSMDKRTIAIKNDIGKYFDSNDEKELNFDSFRSLFFNEYHRKLKDDDIAYYNGVITNMEKDVPEAVEKNIINSLLTLGFATRVANQIDDYQAGEEIDIVEAVFGAAQTTKEALQRTTTFEFADIDSSSIAEGLDETSGLPWCLDILNEVYRPNQPGDATIIAARPGAGKTTFLCHNNVTFAQAMKPNEVILWFNNESRRQKIMSRQIQSALGVADEQLHIYHKDGTLRQRYIDVMGRHDRVQIFDIHGKDTQYVEDIIAHVGPENIGAMVFDMIDKIKFMHLSDSMREDQRLESMYTWSRELGVINECPTFPSSQVSVEGAGLMYPLEHMLKDSKTGKQGACDNILMIGKSDDPMLQRTRGISMPKTKARKAGQTDLMGECLFDEDKGRYV